MAESRTDFDASQNDDRSKSKASLFALPCKEEFDASQNRPLRDEITLIYQIYYFNS